MRSSRSLSGARIAIRPLPQRVSRRRWSVTWTSSTPCRGISCAPRALRRSPASAYLPKPRRRAVPRAVRRGTEGFGPRSLSRRLAQLLLAAALAPQEALLTAHHEDDQLETVLLQLLRGAGLAGMAAMPARAAFARGALVRPLLPWSRAELTAWVRSQGLEWLEDPGNARLRPGRN